MNFTYEIHLMSAIFKAFYNVTTENMHNTEFVFLQIILINLNIEIIVIL